MEQVKRFIIAAMMVTLVLNAGCQKEDVDADEGEAGLDISAKEKAVAGGESKEESSKVVVSVGDESLTEGELTAIIDQQLNSPRLASLDEATKNRYRKQIRDGIVKQFVDRSLLAAAAEKQGIEPEEGKMEEIISDISSNLPDGMTFDQALQMRGMTVAKFKEEINSDLKIEKLVESRLGTIPEVKEEEAKEFYQSSKDQFSAPETVEARHILVMVDKDADKKTRNEKKEEAEKYRKQLLEGADFAQLAKENSSCGSASNGGNLGLIKKGQMVPEFEKAAFSQEVGKIGPLVESKFGYHIIEVLDKNEAGPVPFEEVKQDIIDYLGKQKEQQVILSYIEELKEKADIKYSDEQKVDE